MRAESPGEVVRRAARLLLWFGHCLVGRPVTVAIGARGARMRLPARLRAGGGVIFVLRERYEREIAYVEGNLDEGMVFIDGGANLGIYTAIASRVVGSSGAVLAFEPNKDVFEVLADTARLNDMGNVHLHNVALADKAGIARLYHTLGHSHSYSLGSEGPLAEFEEVETTSIDKALADRGIDRLDFLKLDVEGAEELALRGARHAIESYRPTVLFEWLPGNPAPDQTAQGGAWKELEGAGYDFFTVDDRGELVSIQDLRAGNIIARPRGGGNGAVG